MDQTERDQMSKPLRGADYARMIDDARKRRARALRMKESGMTIQEVGDSLGVTKQRAAELISRARRETRK